MLSVCSELQRGVDPTMNPNDESRAESLRGTAVWTAKGSGDAFVFVLMFFPAACLESSLFGMEA